MGILGRNSKKEPLHYGEAYDVWLYSMGAKGCGSRYRALKFHAGDKELKDVIDDMIKQVELEAAECDEILVHNGIVPSPSLPQRPEAKLENIPVGARFSDMEIVGMLSAEAAAGLILCSQIMGKSIREDIGVLFAKYHALKATIGLKALHLSKEKGWLILPPQVLERTQLEESRT
ncbi:DUF3231 family protein [Paenibacillus paeoniae]|uniref:DUF3231 family protein n=1 Tax=Paenibacillus paeoniae TaxID=2292705 RepID=A0A371P6R0_9BACL|nr:DUF3231 family protein [Paenibacillus paeoniae]REK71623.1 DUF3231 family protein [Paenibacillus paeoniae]